MSAVSIRELKANISQILRRVREKGEAIDVTYRGEVIARLIPVKRARSSRKKLDALWADWDQLAAEIGQQWQGNPSAVEAVREGRR